jgi:hypothetical protein
MDLQLVSLEEIIDELEKRYDGFILAYVKTLDSKKEEVEFQHRGGNMVALGLCEHAKNALLNDEDEYTPL